MKRLTYWLVLISILAFTTANLYAERITCITEFKKAEVSEDGTTCTYIEHCYDAEGTYTTNTIVTPCFIFVFPY